MPRPTQLTMSGGPRANRFAGALRRRNNRLQSVQAASRPRQRVWRLSLKRTPARRHDSTRTRLAARRAWRSPCRPLVQNPSESKHRAGARKADQSFPRRFIPSAELPAARARERFRHRVCSRKSALFALKPRRLIRLLLRRLFLLAKMLPLRYSSPSRTFHGVLCTSHRASRNESPR